MGVDYVVQRDCPAQRAFTMPGFIAAMARRRQSQLFGEIIVEGVRRVIPPGSLPVITTRGDQVERSIATPDDGVLAKWESQCTGCPARTYDQPFGCYGYLAYPIRASTEEWLIERVKPMGGIAAVAMEVLARMGVTGEIAADLRTQGRTFFESASPAGVIWQLTDGPQVTMTSDLLVEVAVFRLPGNPQILPLAAVLLGLVPPTNVDALFGWMKFPKKLAASLIVPADDPEQADFVDYLRQVIVAARGGFELVTDG